ncbi:MAG TPA: sigma 54-interacting transcriptional regulator [Vicinamibacterales bacterium]|nr:sigma 54-interacting transcriptional regulator [Vicinamibacterales bacterium]
METESQDTEPGGLMPLARRLGVGAADLRWFFRVTVNLCTSLAELHRRNVVHGRLNPANILVSADGEDVELVDLGPGWRLGLDAADGGGDAVAYVSPEQTGRINRAVDHRSDFYSLGATLYALLTGTPPFRSFDRLEVIHAHIAKTAQPPAAVDPLVPEQVSRIVMRLLAKSAEDRYQSAIGVRRDFEACERAWTATRTIPRFDPGRHDISERLLISPRLFGRDRELATLTEAFDRTCAGDTSLLLVSGYSGIGKTSLISELYQPLVRQRGYFVTGKFDQVARNIPYGAVIQAFRSLVWQLLTESEDRVADWRRRLSDMLGTHGGVLTEVVPEIEFVIGKQPAPPPVDPAEAQKRFRYAFHSFLGTVAREQNPLIVFLDDLQWVDAATLELLHGIVTAPEIRHLLVIGAYRDNEVDGRHPLSLATGRLQTAGAPVETLSLGPLRFPDVVAFLSDTLRCPPADVTALAKLIVDKTAGNPFFVIQFLKSLQQDGLLRFDTSLGTWRFDMNAVAEAGMTDNVIDLMTGRIRRLSPGAQAVLTLAACIGNRFRWTTLLTVSPLTAEESAAGLAEALGAGLIEPSGSQYEGLDQASTARAGYTFLHDRVQQAAYDLIPVERRARVHLEVGRLLLTEAGTELPEDRLFETVNHLNIGAKLISAPAERLAVARLNLAAGRKAKTSAAYEAACGYFEQGIALLREEHWESNYDLMFGLRLDAAECQYLAGRFEIAEQYFELLLARAATPLDRVKVHSLRIVLYENLSRYSDALSSARDALMPFGLTFPVNDDEASAAAEVEIATVERLRGDRQISSLSALPDMQDPEVQMLMRTLTLMWAGAYISGNQGTARLISATMVRLTLEHGVTADAAYGCVTHAITMGPVKKDYEAAYQWGVLALRLNERFGDTKYRAKIHQQFHAHVNLWRRPFATCIPHAREARRSGLESGDFTYAGYGTATEAWPALMISRSLEGFVRTYSPDLALLERIRMEDFRSALRVLLNWALALQGRTDERLSLSNVDFDEEAFIANHEASAPFFLTFVYIAKLHLCVLLERFELAVECQRRARAVTVVGTMWPVLLDFWGSMAIAGAWTTASESERRGYWTELTAARESLRELAENCPENFRCFWLLVCAEMARVTGHHEDAGRLCGQAITYARQTDNLQQEALGNELCARANLAGQNETAATAHLLNARRAYHAWGASIKVRQLDERYGGLPGWHSSIDAPEQASPAAADTRGGAGAAGLAEATTGRRESTALDMATVLKVARAIAVEIELRTLLPRLMKLALENAGADRALFIREHEGRLVPEAEALADSDDVRIRADRSPEPSDRFAHSVVRYVSRTGQDVVVGNATSDERFAGDPYVVDRRAKSILGVPVVHQGRTDGILYLENSLTSDAFTPERTEIMRILAAQAAISLENARLYEAMKNEVARRIQAEQSLREAVAELEVLKNRLEAENVYLQEEIRTQHNFNEIVGNSPVLLEVLRRVELVAPTESTALLLGETGSGKELFARAVHSRSRRSGRPLVKVNCGAIAPGLVESELFGHAKGAFTGAIEKRVGRFEVANGGTILLDEIGELPLDAQVKLLRVLQEQEFEPVGSSRTIRVDVRIIAATNRDLDQAVRDGRFRADLLYRLNVFPIHIPPLRQRRSDIPLLVSLFVAALARRLGRPLRGFSARSMERLMAYPWPGNVRELQNVVERAAILAAGPVLEVESTFMAAPQEVPDRTPGAGETLDNVQRAHIRAVLSMTGGVVEGTRGAAAILGLHPNTLRSRMRKLGISTTRAEA